MRVLRRSAAVAAAVGGYAALSYGGWPAQARPVVQASAPAQGAAQRGSFDAWLREAGIAAGQVGAIALPLDGAPALLAHDAERPLNPASTIKLLTTYAALTLLGPDYRWRTEARLKGLLQGGVLRGDLILRGGGDPKLVIEDLTEFIARMRAAGLEEIDGDLVIDDAIFDAGPGSVEDFDGDPSQPYNVRPFGALMNFKAVQVLVRPNGTGAGLAFDPPLADVAIDDRVRLLGGPCRHGASGLTVRDGEGGAAGVRISGSYSRACGEQGAFVAVLDHRRFIHGLFKAAWQAAGGRWTGRTRIERGASTGEPWLVWTSPRTLADVVHDINKFSNNVMTRQLMLQMASEAGARPATLADARRVVRAWLAAQGLAFPELVLDNGAGLSRDARRRVLLIEAGGEAKDPDIWNPAAWPALQGRSYDWDYHTEPQVGTAGRVHRWARGRLIGGSSCLHAMGYMRGHPSDFQAWVDATGDSRWSWDSLLPAFQALEDHPLGGNGLYGRGGPMPVYLPGDEVSPVARAYIEAGASLGLPRLEGHNSGQMIGVTPNSLNIRDGRRVTVADAWLTPAVRSRPNLTILR
ncbi:MAG: D-alanyl-D-alanine carboxypeptidase/D-alanyl-D-alanine-endopeptidase, partial [Burkholderiales bacterium]|nr:D-alanyl-D-alanine carboxypeptidase/D-alanyl-D-alanine-endopeptidase [Burkholderiales bacterium]